MRQIGSVTSIAENAVTLYIGDEINETVRKRVHAFYKQLVTRPIQGMTECIPAIGSVTVYYATSPRLTAAEIKGELTARWHEFTAVWNEADIESIASETESRAVEIPVCYGDEYGPDLEIVAKMNGLSMDRVVQIHASGRYPVHMIGFAPGFPYLGGMSSLIAAPRKNQPRVKVPAGSVGIAGEQTGIYPLSLPGGWQIIGRTPLRLFDPQASPPSLLAAGDVVRFVPITKQEFQQLEQSGVR